VIIVSFDLKKFVKKQIQLERRIVEFSERSVEGLQQLLIRNLILGIARDSSKHALLLEALLAILDKDIRLISEEDRRRISESIDDHIRLEEEAIKTYSEILKYVEDPAIRLIIEYILDDEKRHHAFLISIKKKIIEPKTLSHEDLYDWIYQYALGHGGPGG